MTRYEFQELIDQVAHGVLTDEKEGLLPIQALQLSHKIADAVISRLAPDLGYFVVELKEPPRDVLDVLRDHSINEKLVQMIGATRRSVPANDQVPQQ